jgi:hypothetical protein
MLLAIPVATEQRVVFYREQQCHMYGVGLCTLVGCIVELPFLLLSSVMLTVPFFYIAGLDQFGDDSTQKYLYFWLFTFLMLTFSVFFGQVLVASFSDQSTAQSKFVIFLCARNSLNRFC